MPNRILRPWTDSEAVNRLSDAEEVFFVRLIMCADDFGRFYADERLLRSYLYPLRDMRTSDIPRLLAACEKAGLLACYEVNRKRYLEILNFKQRVRSSESKFPSHDGTLSAHCPANDSQMTVICQSHDSHMTALDGDGDGDGINKPRVHAKAENLLTEEELNLFRQWKSVWISQHSRNAVMPQPTEEKQIETLLRIPKHRRIEALNASIQGCWKNIHDPETINNQKGKLNNGKNFSDDPADFSRDDSDKI